MNFKVHSINFDTPSLKKISDEEYFKIGKVDLLQNKDLVLSASFMKQVFDKDLYEMLSKGNPKVDAKLQYIFDLGNAFHTFCLEAKEFENRYYVSDYKDSEEKRTYINSEDMDFIIKVYDNIKLKYPHILEESNYNEIAIFTNFDGVPYRAKIDKLIETDTEIHIIDLKSIWFDFYGKKYRRNKDGIRWGLVKYIQELNYDLQMYCYYKSVKTYLEHNNINKTILTKLLFASKVSFDVKMVTLSSELLNNGREKFKTIFPEIKSFFDGGIKFVEKEEII